MSDEDLPAVMYAWELGGGLGHVAKGLLLADQLAAQGMEVSFAVRDLAITHPVLPDANHRLYQAPVGWTRLRGAPEPASHAELLLHAGFGDAAALQGRVRGWLTLFEADRTRLVIADHSPSALLAARCAGLPTLLFGHGFFVPPAGWPVFRDWEPVAVDRIDSAGQRLLDALNGCLVAFGAPALPGLSALYGDVENFLCTTPELDHYPARGSGVAGGRGNLDRYVGTLWFDDVGGPADWPDADGRSPRVFAYLRPGLPGLDAVLTALRLSGAAVLVASPGLAPAVAAAWRTPRLRFATGLVALREVARDADLVVCSGSDTLHGLAQSGVPVLGLPLSAEQRIAAERVARTGAGRWVLPGNGVDALLAAVRDLLGSPHYREAARELQRRHPRRAPAVQLAPVVAACRRLLAPAPPA